MTDDNFTFFKALAPDLDFQPKGFFLKARNLHLGCEVQIWTLNDMATALYQATAQWKLLCFRIELVEILFNDPKEVPLALKEGQQESQRQSKNRSQIF